MIPLHRPIVLLLLTLPSLPAMAALQAWLDRDRVEPGEAVELTLQRDGRSDNRPDLAPLRRDFAILGRASGSTVQIVNGRMTAQVQLRLTLSPKHAGRITVPALNWDGERSPPLALSVAGNAAGAAAASAHVFLTGTLEQKQPYVQAATTLKLRVYSDQPLYQASLDLPAGNDVLIQQVGKDRQSSETRGGRRYQVIERDYLLFPQRSGRISLTGPVLQAQVVDSRGGDASTGDPFFDRAIGSVFGGNPFAGMMNATRPLRLQGDAIVLDARPRPAAAAGQDWLPARQVGLEESWRPDAAAVRTGEPLTRHLRLSALGLSAAQLPDLAARMPLPEGIKAYPDQPRLNTEAQDGNEMGNVIGSREQDIALIASRPGRYVLPAMRLAWWDTARNSPREAVLPARTLEILPGPGGGAAGAPPSVAAPVAPATDPPGRVAASAGTAFPWPWLSLALGLLWLATLAAWWRARRAGPGSGCAATAAVAGVDSVRALEARRAFRQACRDNAAPAARRNLLAWARANWPHDPPTGLNALARRLPDPRLSALLRELDRACYAGGEWRGGALAEALAALPDGVERTRGKAPQLAGLYP
jgi:hypothetical protein